MAPARPPVTAPAVPNVGKAPAAGPPSDDPPTQVTVPPQPIVPSASHPDYDLLVVLHSPLIFSSAEMPPLESPSCSNEESMETSTHVLDSPGFVIQSSPPGLDVPNPQSPSQNYVPSQNSVSSLNSVSILGDQVCPIQIACSTLSSNVE